VERRIEELNRITHDPAVMAGMACIRGMRISVSMVVGKIASGHCVDETFASYPYLEQDDILHALCYAVRLAS
jgi:uncharacterized protein (DUF433 family)